MDDSLYLLNSVLENSISGEVHEFGRCINILGS